MAYYFPLRKEKLEVRQILSALKNWILCFLSVHLTTSGRALHFNILISCQIQRIHGTSQTNESLWQTYPTIYKKLKWNVNVVNKCMLRLPRFVPYCSSDIWSGNRSADLMSETRFSFMGAVIVEQVVKELLGQGMSSASTLLLAGSRYASHCTIIIWAQKRWTRLLLKPGTCVYTTNKQYW